MTTVNDSPSLVYPVPLPVDEQPKWKRIFFISIVLAAIQLAPLLAWLYSLAELTLQAGLWLGLFFTAPVWLLVAMRHVTNRLGFDAKVYPSHDRASAQKRWEKWVISIGVLLQFALFLLFFANVVLFGFLQEAWDFTTATRWLTLVFRDSEILTIATSIFNIPALLIAAILTVSSGTVLRLLGCRDNAMNLFLAGSITTLPVLLVAVYGNLWLQFTVSDILASFAFGGVLILALTPAIVSSIAFNSKRYLSTKSQVHATYALLILIQFLWIIGRLFGQALTVIH